MANNYTNNFLQKGYSSLDPNTSYSNTFTGYRVDVGSLGTTTDPRTANQIKDVSDKLSSGLKEIDVTLIQPKMVELVSKEQMQDINKLSKLTGIDVSVHGPVIDTIGVNQQGYDELNRKHSENVIINTLEKSYHVNPKGNVNVTFHTSEGLTGSTWKTLGDTKKGKEGEYERLIAIDRETGKSTVLKPEERFYPGGEKGKVREIKHAPEENLEMQNRTQWENEIVQVEFNRESAERIMQNSHKIFPQLYAEIEKNQREGKPIDYNMSPEEKSEVKKIYSANEYLEEAERKARSLFSKAYEFTKKYEEGEKQQTILSHLDNVSKKYSQLLGMDEKGKFSSASINPQIRSDALLELEKGIKVAPPEQFVALEEFATEKSSQTFGNAAYASYKKHKDNAPIISIENPPVGQALATGEDLRNVIEGSREVFVEKLMKEEKKSEKEAKKIAEKLIGATWDVGHINILRNQGFEKEDIIRESEKIKPYLKHVHLSDNFGLEHTELPMGMGNVPFKEIMKKLGKEGFDAKKVIEAGDFWSQQMNPLPASLEGLGSPIYTGTSSAPAKQPYWNQSPGFHQGYSQGLEGNWLPGINYQQFGTYFSQLPTELGGQAPGAQGSRMSGRPME